MSKDRMQYRTITGNVVSDPLTKVVEGHDQTVTEFRVIYNPRVRNDADEWEDGDPIAYDVSMWGAKGEALDGNLRKGYPVVVFGEYEEKPYPRRDGAAGMSRRVIARAVGIDVTNPAVQASWSPARGRLQAVSSDGPSIA